MNILPFGDRALLVNFEQKINPEINMQVLALHKAIAGSEIKGIEYSTSAYCSLTIGFTPEVVSFEVLSGQIKSLATKKLKSNHPGQTLNIPVCYDPVFAMDMKNVCQQTGLSVDSVIKLHTAQTYQVYMIGFLPGFAYMGSVNEKIQVSRKLTPRLKVPSGAIGLAGSQTGIYPSEAPGGWQIIGRTPVSTFNPTAGAPFLMQPGDNVTFKPISVDVFNELKDKNPIKREDLYE